MALADKIVGVESGGNATARNPRSSATGTGQFIDSTWLSMMAKHRPDLVAGKSPAEILAMRTDPDLSRAMVDAYAQDNSAVLSGAGLPVTPGTQYLAHFAGPKGAVGLLSADPTLPVGSVLGEAAMRANPFLAGKSVGDVIAWADGKMGGPAPAAPAPLSMAPPPAAQSAEPTQPAAAQPAVGAPLSLAPQQPAATAQSNPWQFGQQQQPMLEAIMPDLSQSILPQHRLRANSFNRRGLV